jgi:hypothetical protein
MTGARWRHMRVVLIDDPILLVELKPKGETIWKKSNDIMAASKGSFFT